jgi:hypothetical protein
MPKVIAVLLVIASCWARIAPGADLSRSAIDHYVRDRLIEVGLKPAPMAGRGELIRRLKYDLLGLPPTSEEIDCFVDDERPDAWERLIDRFLDSPHYGERWAQHWLDVVRFSESHGFEDDKPRPDAWPYRDYVKLCALSRPQIRSDTTSRLLPNQSGIRRRVPGGWHGF